MKSKKLLIAGGDMRQIYCAKRLSESRSTAILGFDEKYILPDTTIKQAQPVEHEEYDAVVLPVPAMNGDVLNCPCYSSKLEPETIIPMLRSGAVIYAGKADEKLRRRFAPYEVIDYMEREELSLLNSIPTAEGAVMLALEELPITLSGAKALVVGCGRIGGALIKILNGFGCEVTAAVRNAKGAAKARIFGAKSVLTDEMADSYDVIFNTVPSMIFDSHRLSKLGKSVLVIDLASKPGGVDFDAAAELGIKAIWALGLPGKTAPITAGEMIAETIEAALSERSKQNG